MPFTFGDDPSFMGDSVSVQCTISSGDMPIKFVWFYNGNPLTDKDGINVGLFGKKTSVLGIDNIAEHHAGNYTCLAQNLAGMSAYSSELIVRGKENWNFDWAMHLH